MQSKEMQMSLKCIKMFNLVHHWRNTVNFKILLLMYETGKNTKGPDTLLTLLAKLRGHRPRHMLLQRL